MLDKERGLYIAHSDNGSVLFQSDSVIPADRDFNNIRPSSNIALPVIDSLPIKSSLLVNYRSRNYRTIRFQTDCMICSS
jgi:hypothetical protein